MNLRKMQSINFKSIKDQIVPPKGFDIIELPNGLYLIRGKNSTGKSVFVESMMWGIWGGKGPRKCGIISEIHDKVIRQTSAKQQKSTCKVSIDFEVNKQLYNITRSKAPSNQATVKFARIKKDIKTEDEIEVDILTDSLKVCEKLNEIFNCSADDVQKTFYVRQGEVDYLATRTASELREHFETLFKLKDFTEELKEILDEMIQSVDGEIASLEKEKSDIESQKEKLEYIKTQKTKNEEELNDYKENMNKIQAKLEKYPEISDVKHLIQILEQRQTFDNKISLINEKLNADIGNKNETMTMLSKKESERNAIGADINKDKKLLEKFPDSENLTQISEINDSITTLNEQKTKNTERLLQKSKEIMETEIPGDLKLLEEAVKNQNLSLIDKLNNLNSDLEARSKENLTISEEISKFKALKSELENNISLLSEKSECPTCLTIIEHESHKKEIFDRIQGKIDQYLKDEVEFKEKKENIEEKIKELKGDIEQTNEKKGKIEKLSADLDNILRLDSEVTEKTVKLKELLSKLKVEQYKDLLKKFNISNLKELISKINRTHERLNQNQLTFSKFLSETADFKTKLTQIDDHCGIFEKEIGELKKKLEKIIEISGTIYKKLGIVELEDYLGKFNSGSLGDLKDQVTEVQNEKKNIEENITRLKKTISELASEIKDIQEEIKLLDDIKKKIEEKQRTSNHLNAIKKQYLDKFISQEVIQNKLFKSVRNEVSGYLLQFSDGQYVLKEVKPAGKDKKGIEFILYDNFDGIDKTMDYLSGGDKAVFGLALRIGLSNLMARIKPFKTSEIKPINFDMLILDEPLSNMDARRRERVIRHLNEDKNFSQIFLITHTPELDDEQFNHRILVTKTAETGSQYRLIPRLSTAD